MCTASTTRTLGYAAREGGVLGHHTSATRRCARANIYVTPVRARRAPRVPAASEVGLVPGTRAPCGLSGNRERPPLRPADVRLGGSYGCARTCVTTSNLPSG